MVSLTLKFTISGTDLTVAKTTDYRLISVTGLESPAIELEMFENAAMDGSAFAGARIPQRIITASFIVTDAADTNTARTALMSFFKPKVAGLLAVTRGSTVREIDFYLAGVEFFNPDASIPKLRVTVTMICPIPYFRAATPITSNETSANVIAVTNSGDVPCGFVLTIVATGGSVVTPSIVLTSGDGETVSVDLTMASTDVLVISTVAGNCYVTHEGTVVYTYSLDSDFFKLAIGNNTITLNAGTGSSYIVGSISYEPLYLGV